eukprot:scaffold111284_cov84-Cyclotella_meneghiniana.AAC.1
MWLQNCGIRSWFGRFFNYDVRDTAGRKIEEKRAAAALPGARMLTLGPGGVAAAGGWSIALVFSRYWPPW